MLKFAGIQNPFTIGQYSVEKNAKILKRYRFIHERLISIASGHLPARENWDVKVALGKHLFEDAEATNELIKRISDLRTTAKSIHQEPDASLSLVMDELIHARNDLELMVGIYDVIKPAILKTYHKHMINTQQIVDQPTIRILRMITMDLEEQVLWGQNMIKDIERANIYPEGAAEFKSKIQSYLDSAGGIDGDGQKSPVIPHRWRSYEPYKLPFKSVRDPRNMGPTTLARTSVPIKQSDPLMDRLLGMMRIRQEEMTAAELIAGVLYSQKNMPWEFYYDLARHVWDEIRHALFGQAALEAEGIDWMSRPQYTSDYDVNAPKIPGAQYAWLTIGIEEGAMKRTGKRAQYEFCRDEAKHPLMAQFQDYDWADEVVHANFGRKWTPELIGENIEFVRDVAQKELDHYWSRVNPAQRSWEAN